MGLFFVLFCFLCFFFFCSVLFRFVLQDIPDIGLIFMENSLAMGLFFKIFQGLPKVRKFVCFVAKL